MQIFFKEVIYNFVCRSLLERLEIIEKIETFLFLNRLNSFCKFHEQFRNSTTTEPVFNRRFFKKHQQFLRKVPQMISKLSKSQNFSNSFRAEIIII